MDGIFFDNINFFTLADKIIKFKKKKDKQVFMKMVILVRSDLKLPKGKMAAQVAHAAVDCVLKADNKRLLKWLNEGAAKICLKVENEKELLRYYQLAKKDKLNASLISDAGKTVVAPGTKTCLGIGPDEDEKIDKITGKLPLM